MLNIRDETAPLTDLCVCRGISVPDHDTFASDHPEFEAFRMLPWNRERLLVQQDRFHALLDSLGIRLHFVPTSPGHPWQMYTRDTGFVIGDQLFYAPDRGLPERRGEINLVRKALPQIPDDAFVEITEGRIEGGDVMPDGDRVYVGVATTRTTPAAAQALAARLARVVSRDIEVVPLHLGPTVMHLDTRMTILPDRRLLINPTPFRRGDRDTLAARFQIIEVTDAEARAMGTNVFVPNPETVVVHTGFERIAAEIETSGLKVERLDWSEPNALLGSFRCATMPLTRAG